MAALTRVFLESPLQLAGVSLVLLLLAYGIWLHSTSERWRLLVFPVALGVIVVLFAVQEFVTTQREELERTLDRMIAAVARHDAAAIGPMIAAGYDGGDMDRRAVMRFIEEALKNTDIYDARIGAMQVETRGDRATTEFSVTATVRVRGFTGRVPSRWRLQWVRGGGGWQVGGIEPLEVAGNRVAGLRSLRHW